jgi:NAD-dependent DNA ligase
MKFTLEQKRAMRRDPLAFAKTYKLPQLSAILAELDDRYQENAPVVTDEIYDIMDDYRWTISKRAKSAKDVGGTKNVDIVLEVPMASLDKFHTLTESRRLAFMKATSYTLSDKEDGISLSITYQDGAPILATTRGKKGTVGKNVSKIIPHLRIPKTIPYKGRFIVRAEFTIDKTTFKKYFPDDKTGRNTAGGLLNRDVVHEHAKKFRTVCYEILLGKGAGIPLNEQLAILERYKFDVVPHIVVKKITQEALVKYHDQRKQESGRDIDGVVVAQNVKYRAGEGYPDHSYAFKINSIANSVVVPVKDVLFAESRLGKLSQRIEIEPTIIGGVEVSFFTAHNYEYIEKGYSREQVKKNGGKAPYKPRPLNKGAIIRCVRSGDVIPYIMEVVEGAKKPAVPTIPNERKGAFLYAVHEGKSDLRQIKELTYFFTVLEVDGVKQGVVTKLVNAGYDTVRKILDMDLADIKNLPAYGETSAVKLHKALKTVKSKMTFLNVAQGSAAFGEGIGEKRLQLLFDEIPELLDTQWNDSQLARRIRDVKGFDKLADQIAGNLNAFVKFCKRNGIKLVAAKKAEVVGSKMKGQSVLFTSVRDAEAQAWIVANGGKIASTVNQATLLITKDADASNKKTVEAESKGIPVQPIDTFRNKHGI